MSEPTSLVEFLADLRHDLSLARSQAVTAAAEGIARGDSALWFDVEELTVTLEVMHSRTTSAEIKGALEGKFWVFGSVKGEAKGTRESSQSGTQTLTLKLTPRVQSISRDNHGNVVVTSTSIEISGALESGEQIPPPAGKQPDN